MTDRDNAIVPTDKAIVSADRSIEQVVGALDVASALDRAQKNDDRVAEICRFLAEVIRKFPPLEVMARVYDYDFGRKTLNQRIKILKAVGAIPPNWTMPQSSKYDNMLKHAIKKLESEDKVLVGFFLVHPKQIIDRAKRLTAIGLAPNLKITTKSTSRGVGVWIEKTGDFEQVPRS